MIYFLKSKNKNNNDLLSKKNNNKNNNDLLSKIK